MIVEREEEIEAFKPREYWTIEADLQKDGQEFVAKLSELHGKKLTQFAITHGDKAHEVEHELTAAAKGELIVYAVEKKQRKRNPSAPFTTSTLQQEASRKLGFSASRTMRVAQQLYEGIDIGGGRGGSHHLHAHRLGESGQRGAGRDPRADRRALRQGQCSGRAARVQDQGQERPGGP
jgi:DNA topoisomerase I